jgi:hypothetical protein
MRTQVVKLPPFLPTRDAFDAVRRISLSPPVRCVLRREPARVCRRR